MFNLEIPIVVTHYGNNIETYRGINLKQFHVRIRSTYRTSYLG